MSAQERRISLRMPLQVSVTEHLHDHTQQSLMTNIGPEGLFLNRLNSPHVLSVSDPHARVLGLEFRLPDLPETIWASGEIRYHQHDAFFQRSGVQFLAMAQVHRNLIDDYVRECRIVRLRELLARVRRNRPN